MLGHIMLDLETLDTEKSAVVLSIGAVAFDPHTNATGERFYVELTDDLLMQQRAGRTISANTVKWWLQQDVLARRVFATPPAEGVSRSTTYDGLVLFGGFVERNGGHDGAKIWGNGADFDNAILGDLYKTFDVYQPWNYGSNRCYRTLKNLGFGPRAPVHRSGVHHNALDDAITQAQHLQEIYACLDRR